MFSLSRKKGKGYFTDREQEKIVAAIREAERLTSGEIRVFVEGKCRFVDAIDWAGEIFYQLRMNETLHHNATLIYVAMKHRQVAIYGDEGIFRKTGSAFWHETIGEILLHFNKENYVTGICEVVQKLGQALAWHFPFEPGTDKNELPDQIVFGK